MWMGLMALGVAFEISLLNQLTILFGRDIRPQAWETFETKYYIIQKKTLNYLIIKSTINLNTFFKMKKISHYSKSLAVERSKPYGIITIYFESSDSAPHKLPQLSLTKFIALCQLLENESVYYNSKKKIFFTPSEESNDTIPKT